MKIDPELGEPQNDCNPCINNCDTSTDSLSNVSVQVSVAKPVVDSFPHEKKPMNGPKGVALHKSQCISRDMPPISLQATGPPNSLSTPRNDSSNILRKVHVPVWSILIERTDQLCFNFKSCHINF
jgi:hypothetical protein